MNTTIFKTGNRLKNSSMSVGKFVYNIPGGLQNSMDIGHVSCPIFIRLPIDPDAETIQYRTIFVRTFNGSLLRKNVEQTIEDNYPSTLINTYTDSDGDVVREYAITNSYYSAESVFSCRIAVGTTRVEVLNPEDMEGLGLECAAGNYYETETEMNIEQFEFLPCTNIRAYHGRKAYGDIKALKNRTDIRTLYVSESNVTGDIKHLIKSALTFRSLYVYKTNISGNLNELLDAIVAAGVTSGTFTATLGYSNVKIDGTTPTGTLHFDFDNQGWHRR